MYASLQPQHHSEVGSIYLLQQRNQQLTAESNSSARSHSIYLACVAWQHCFRPSKRTSPTYVPAAVSSHQLRIPWVELRNCLFPGLNDQLVLLPLEAYLGARFYTL